jgi:hypothetical protein
MLSRDQSPERGAILRRSVGRPEQAEQRENDPQHMNLLNSDSAGDQRGGNDFAAARRCAQLSDERCKSGCESRLSGSECV